MPFVFVRGSAFRRKKIDGTLRHRDTESSASFAYVDSFWRKEVHTVTPPTCSENLRRYAGVR